MRAGCLVHSGQRLVILGPQYLGWLQKQSSRVDDFEIAPNRVRKANAPEAVDPAPSIDPPTPAWLRGASAEPIKLAPRQPSKNALVRALSTKIKPRRRAPCRIWTLTPETGRAPGRVDLDVN